MVHTPFYDPNKSYEDNMAEGPFGEFANTKVYSKKVEIRKNKFLGQNVFLPFGIAAGPLPNSNFVITALEKGFDIAVYKTVRTGFVKSHSWPNIVPVKISGESLNFEEASEGLVQDSEYKTPIAITNSFGVGSLEPDEWQPDMKKAVDFAKEGQVVVGSFQGTNRGEGIKKFIEDYRLGARLVHETGAKVIAVNLSCPNEGKSNLLCYDRDTVFQIAKEVKEEVGNTPVYLKLAYFENNSEYAELIKEIGNIVEGIAVINTIPAKVYSDESKTTQALPGEGRLVSGICGAPIKWAGQDMVKRGREIVDDLGLNLQIIGVGGVTTPDDYEEYRSLGADAVLCATGAMWNPFLAQQIWEKFNN
jgi:dihydroorotate dehydrogenase (NAD+) catalytic subunit